MFDRRTPRRNRLAATALAGVATIAVGALVAASCSRVEFDELGSDSQQSTVLETTTEVPTTLATTTTVAPTTTTTTKPWPKGPVLTIPAAGAVPVISTIATADPVVFLTIDDGTIRDPRVPELLTKLSPAAQRNEICGMKDIIGQHTFVAGHLFRAPYGVSNAVTQTAAGSCGINAVLFWHASLNDGRIQYQQGNQLQPGDIILTHFRTDLYDNIRALLWQCALQGLTIAPIEDYLPLPASG